MLVQQTVGPAFATFAASPRKLACYCVFMPGSLQLCMSSHIVCRHRGAVLVNATFDAQLSHLQ